MKKNLAQHSQNEKKNNDAALSFISAGVACYAFSLIDELGILDILHRKEILSVSKILSYPNPLVLQSAFQTLETNGIIVSKDKIISLTEFGRYLYKHRGSIGLIYNSYRNVLANQFKIASDQPSYRWNLVDSIAVSKASISFTDGFLNDLLIDFLSEDSFQGIADLGCGEGSRLLSLCRKLGLSGIGFDLSKKSIKKAKLSLHDTDTIKFFNKDISKLKLIYPNIDILIQEFVMHDLSDDLYKQTMDSFLLRFPNVKKFIYIDAFAPENDKSIQLPGFDYVHSLLNVKTRTRKDTLLLLKHTGFNLNEEFPIEGLPNCYIWILTPIHFKNLEG